MKRNRVSAITAGAALVVGSTLTLMSPAVAADVNPFDPTFVPNTTDDLVGVGSDTTQIVTHDLAVAYNAGRASGRLASFAADGTPATVTLRSGLAAITRPNGSGAGKKLLYAPDNNANVSFARSSSTLSPAEITGGLKQAAFAVDGLQMAVSASATNAPADLTIDQILKIYKGEVTNWSQVGGRPGTIKALIPQSGSGTLSFFTSQLTAANGGIPFTPVATSTQEHSDADVKGDPNAIAPFSSARTTITSTVAALGGWKATRAVYNVVRTADLANATVGARLTNVFGEDGWICGPDGRAVIEKAGFEQLASTEDGGACGQFVTDPVSNLKTSDQADAVVTTTTLAASAPGQRTVGLRATVGTGGGAPAAGKVEFREGDALVGTAFTSGGVASLTLTGVSVGTHQYTASFVPTRVNDFAPSQSTVQQVVVKTPAAVSVTGVSAPYGKAKTVTVKATVGGAAATGTVRVAVGGGAARAYTLSRGTATVSVAAATPAGSLRVTASLPGSASVDAASGSATLRIAKAKGAVTAKLVKAKVKASQRGVLRVAVKPAGVPVTGKVTVKVGSKVVGRGVVRNGKVTVKLAKLKKGTHRLVVAYGGNGNVTGAKAKVLKIKVTR
ncbi:Ig-like domain repeat protein [Aeromicrobium tamlense]|uniref:ABC-type phosphate transport system substrate-binding protein n=1 Tax=Aeromicrobium tamlense TaxID=375541 RepID=A0A8I0FVY2_9ACTN|nr:Ig-like domain repeat protein [Aeromicrobium tamlense]MBD1271680.1 Ig-like domain repeat protein [Aeromicrobium tamlense]NYI37573.1 ABC-type phosphate transport system substrate-binding protein [Aeromicrobium tamlense]